MKRVLSKLYEKTYNIYNKLPLNIIKFNKKKRKTNLKPYLNKQNSPFYER